MLFWALFTLSLGKVVSLIPYATDKVSFSHVACGGALSWYIFHLLLDMFLS